MQMAFQFSIAKALKGEIYMKDDYEKTGRKSAMFWKFVSICSIVWLMSFGFVFGQKQDERKLELVVETSHSSQVESVAISQDGKLLASAGGNIIIWDAITGKFVKQLGGEDSQNFVVFSPDGKILASCDDRQLTLWDIDTGEQKNKWNDKFYGVNKIAFSPDGKILATTFIDGTITIWDVEKGLKKKFKAHGTALSVAFSLDGSVLATSGEDKEFPIKIWDVKTWKLLSAFKGHQENILDAVRVWSVEFSPDGETIATSSFDNTVKIWDWKNRRELQNLKGHDDLSRATAFSSDGKLIATGGDGQIKLWDTSTGDLKAELGEKYENAYDNLILSMKFSGRMLISGSSKSISFWNIDSGKPEKVLKYKNIVSVAPSSNGNILAVNFGSDVRLLDLANYQFDTLLNRYNNEISRVIFSPDGKLLAGICEGYWDEATKIIIWDVKTKKEIEIIKRGENTPDWLAPDVSGQFTEINGRKVKFLTERSILKLLNNSDNKEIASIVLLEENNWAVITPDGRFDASEGALKLMHYTYGRDIINLEQLKQMYYAPGLLQKLLHYSTEPLNPILPLRDVKLYPEIVEQKFDSNTGKLNLQLKSGGGGIGNIEVFINGIRVIADARDKKLRQNPYIAANQIINLTIDLPASSFLRGKENQIKVVTSNYVEKIDKGNIQSPGTEVTYLDQRKKEPGLPNFYAIVGGITDYAGEKIDLRYASKDAEDFSEALRLGANRLFCPSQNTKCLNKINITTLSTARDKPEEQPTKENFKKAFADIAAIAKPEDILVVYLSGHGVSLKNTAGSYAYLTKEASSLDSQYLEPASQMVAISHAELMDWLTPNRDNPSDIFIKTQKKVIILDTCAAGNFADDDEEEEEGKGNDDLTFDQIRAMETLKTNTGTLIIMGNVKNRSSYQSSRYNQSLLTYALLEGMKGGGLQKPHDFIDVRRLFDYAEKRVPELANAISLEQHPIIKQPAGNTFLIGQMTETERNKIKLSQLKPLMLRPSLVNAADGDDNLDLISLLGKMLDAESSYEILKRRDGTQPIMAYSKDNSGDNGIRVTGTYTISGETVQLKAYLKRDGRIIFTFPEFVGKKEVILEKLLVEIRKQLVRI